MLSDKIPAFTKMGTPEAREILMKYGLLKPPRPSTPEFKSDEEFIEYLRQLREEEADERFKRSS